MYIQAITLYATFFLTSRLLRLFYPFLLFLFYYCCICWTWTPRQRRASTCGYF